MCICVFTKKTAFWTSQIHIDGVEGEKHLQGWKTVICKFVYLNRVSQITRNAGCVHVDKILIFGGNSPHACHAHF